MPRMVQPRSNVRCKCSKATTVAVPSSRANGLLPLLIVLLGMMNNFLHHFFLSFLTKIHIDHSQTAQNLEIYVGSNDLKNGGTYYKIEKFKAHEEYNTPSFANDVAVIRVQGEIALNDKVKTIEYSSEEVPDGALLQLTGWGRLQVSFFCACDNFKEYFQTSILVIGRWCITTSLAKHHFERCSNRKMQRNLRRCTSS